jgi:hypothetical protein
MSRFYYEVAVLASAGHATAAIAFLRRAMVLWGTIEGGDSSVDRPPLERVAGETWKQMQMKMRDGVPVNLIVHLRGLHQFVEGSGH